MARLIDAVVGHRAVWRNLEQLRAQDRLPHALAFVGPAGIGKSKLAWALAQALVCEREGAPCGECPACCRVERQQSESVLQIQPDKAAIKLEAAHEVLQFLTLQRLGRARVILVDGAQALNPQAANALLKAVEEPPEATYFIFLVNELGQLLPTLRSRLQVQRFAPLSEAEIQRGEDVPAWKLRSARGSFAQLELFRDPESEELRLLAAAFLEDALNGRRAGLAALLERGKEREVAQKAVHFMQQLLRDWAAGSDSIHADLQQRLGAWPALAPAERVELWRKAYGMEQDLAAHVDRGLVFENFFYRAGQAAKISP